MICLCTITQGKERRVTCLSPLILIFLSSLSVSYHTHLTFTSIMKHCFSTHCHTCQMPVFNPSRGHPTTPTNFTFLYPSSCLFSFEASSFSFSIVSLPPILTQSSRSNDCKEKKLTHGIFLLPIKSLQDSPPPRRQGM